MIVACLPAVPDAEHYKTRVFLDYLGHEAVRHGPKRPDARLWISNLPRRDSRRREWDINGRMISSSKFTVSDCQEKAFGYGYKLDPRTYHGIALAKWHWHSRQHRLIQCPSDGEKETFFSELLEGPEARIAVFGKELVCTFTRRERDRDGVPNERRVDGSSRHDIPWQDVCSKTEREKLLAFCQLIGMDYGEMDVIRHTKDGRFCVVDCNPGPSPALAYSFTPEDYARIVPREADMFGKLL